MAVHRFDQTDREMSFRTLADQCFDLLVIGGGITGAGVARDAAMRGLSVALIEAQDLASGTSSRSSKMIHGGLRYSLQVTWRLSKNRPLSAPRCTESRPISRGKPPM